MEKIVKSNTAIDLLKIQYQTIFQLVADRQRLCGITIKKMAVISAETSSFLKKDSWNRIEKEKRAKS